MGGTTVNYYRDPEQAKQIQKLSQKISQIQKERHKQLEQMTDKYRQTLQEIQKMKDPNKIEENQRLLFNSFLSQLKSFNFMNPIPRQNGLKFISLIGENSAGKSSAFNWILGTKEKVGVDDTTQNIVQIPYTSDKFCYFDTPGLNQSICIENAQYLKAIYSIDKIAILTPVTFKNSKRTIQVLDKINPPQFILVRSQCDKFQTDEEFKSAKSKDEKLLKQWGIKREILYISARRPMTYKDNQRFKKFMTT